MGIINRLRQLYGQLPDDQIIEVLRGKESKDIEIVRHYLDRRLSKLKKEAEAKLVSRKEREDAYSRAFSAFLRLAKTDSFQIRKSLNDQFEELFYDQLLVYQIRSKDEKIVEHAKAQLGKILIDIDKNYRWQDDQEVVEIAVGETIIAILKMAMNENFFLIRSFGALFTTIFLRKKKDIYRKKKLIITSSTDNELESKEIISEEQQDFVSPILSEEIQDNGEIIGDIYSEEPQLNLLIDRVRNYISGEETAMLDKLSQKIKYSIYDKFSNYMEDFSIFTSKIKEFKEKGNKCAEILLIKAQEGTTFKDIYLHLHNLGDIEDEFTASNASKIKSRINERVRYCRDLLYKEIEGQLNFRYRKSRISKKSRDDG